MTGIIKVYTECVYYDLDYTEVNVYEYEGDTEKDIISKFYDDRKRLVNGNRVTVEFIK